MQTLMVEIQSGTSARDFTDRIKMGGGNAKLEYGFDGNAVYSCMVPDMDAASIKKLIDKQPSFRLMK